MKLSICTWVGILVVVVFCCGKFTSSQTEVRGRDLGIFFEGKPGSSNAITDVSGVKVGHTTLIRGEGTLEIGVGPVRTGVTVLFPRGEDPTDPVFGGWFALNGNGEMTGTTWVEESGFLEGPISITNTHSVGTVRDAVIAWQAKKNLMFQPWSLPVVAETYDGTLNDINGFHVKAEHVISALETASGGLVAEGNVGGGTGMSCYEFKCGIGTASRVLTDGDEYTIGVLVQANFGRRSQLRVDGVPVGRELLDEHGEETLRKQSLEGDQGSIIAIVATDAPLLPHQLKRVAKRVSLGIARTGGTSGDGSGDIFVAFSTANAGAAAASPTASVSMVAGRRISSIFSATVQATEEAIINALVAGKTMVGRDNNRSEAISHERLKEILRHYNRLHE